MFARQMFIIALMVSVSVIALCLVCMVHPQTGGDTLFRAGVVGVVMALHCNLMVKFIRACKSEPMTKLSFQQKWGTTHADN